MSCYFLSAYLQLDKSIDNIVEKIYTLSKEIIKNNNIRGNAITLNKIFGIKELSAIDRLKRENMHLPFSQIICLLLEDEEYKDLFDRLNQIYQSIENNYNEYLEVCRLEDKYVTKLEEEGRIRRNK